MAKTGDKKMRYSLSAAVKIIIGVILSAIVVRMSSVANKPVGGVWDLVLIMLIVGGGCAVVISVCGLYNSFKESRERVAEDRAMEAKLRAHIERLTSLGVKNDRNTR